MSFKILSLDGGGSWAILEVMALGEIFGFDAPGQTILNRFDLAVSNSGGSIVLAGLAINLSPQKIADLLNNPDNRNSIFVKNLIRPFGLERYKTPDKLDALQKLLTPGGDQPVDSFRLNCKLLIATFDYDRLREQFFRSDPHSPAATTPGIVQPTLVEAVHASTNAPIKFFDAPAEFPNPAFAGRRFWDGAMGGFNNPAMAGLTEALAYGVAPNDVRILSIGTANVFLPMPDPLPSPGDAGQNPLCVQIASSGLLHDAEAAIVDILDDPPDQASFMAHLITSGSTKLSSDPAKPVTDGNLVRLNPWIQPVKGAAGWQAPLLLNHAPQNSNVPDNYASDAEAFEALCELELDAIEQDDFDLIRTLGNAWIADDAPNQSIRATPDLQPLIGHKNFCAALAQARVLGLA